MPAGIPGATSAQNQGNPTQGFAVMLSLFSGPKGSPRDNDKDYAAATNPYFGSAGAVANTNCSTGALTTGIGFGPNLVLDSIPTSGARNFTDDYTPGVSKPDATASADSTIMLIGGGKCNANVNGYSLPVPYTAGFGLGAAGQSAGRDAGAGPTAFTGFLTKIVTAAAGIANGAVVETGFNNRSGVALLTGQSTLGVGTAVSVAPSMAGEEDEPPRAPPRVPHRPPEHKALPPVPSRK